MQEDWMSHEESPSSKLRKRKKSKTTFSIKSGHSSKRRHSRALTFGNHNLHLDKDHKSGITFKGGHIIPVDRDSVVHRNEFLPTLSNRVDKRQQGADANYAWID